MPDYTLGRSVIVCKDAFAYLSHPSITVLEGGEWLAAFNHSRRRDPRRTCTKVNFLQPIL